MVVRTSWSSCFKQRRVKQKIGAWFWRCITFPVFDPCFVLLQSPSGSFFFIPILLFERTSMCPVHVTLERKEKLFVMLAVMVSRFAISITILKVNPLTTHPLSDQLHKDSSLTVQKTIVDPCLYLRLLFPCFLRFNLTNP